MEVLLNTKITYVVPSGNQTWYWKMSMNIGKSPISRVHGFQHAMFDDTGGYVCMCPLLSLPKGFKTKADYFSTRPKRWRTQLNSANCRAVLMWILCDWVSYGPRSIFVIVFQVLVYKQMLSFFEECIIVFQASAQFTKIKMSRILRSIQLNFGCSSYEQLTS